LGLSEETDAPIVIVSEESGTISYAYKGQLVRGVTVEVRLIDAAGNESSWRRVRLP
jgi:hypothetical protein